MQFDPGDFPAAFERGARPPRLQGLAGPPGPAAKWRAAPRHRASPATSRAPVSGRTRGPTCASIRGARSTSHRRGPAGAGPRHHAGPDRRRRAGGAARGRHRGGGRHRAVPVRHGHGRQPRGRQRRPGGGAHRARGAGQGRPGGRRSPGVRARGRAHRGRRRARWPGCPRSRSPWASSPTPRSKSKALLKASGEPGLNACTYFSPETVTWAFGTQAAVVEVDVETCAVRLLHYVVVHDPGRADQSNDRGGPASGRGGAGIAAGLFEEIVYDSTASSSREA